MKIVIAYDKMIAVVSAVLVLFVVSIGVLFWRSFPVSVPSRVTNGAPSVAPGGQEGDVTVDVAHDAASTATKHQFTLTLDTHTGDLSSYDAAALMTYRTADGKEVGPTSVGGDRETHHREIIVTFEGVELPGMVVVKSLRGVPERTFPFTL